MNANGMGPPRLPPCFISIKGRLINFLVGEASSFLACCRSLLFAEASTPWAELVVEDGLPLAWEANLKRFEVDVSLVGRKLSGGCVASESFSGADHSASYERLCVHRRIASPGH